ncbi:velvet factor [Fimicolochytrium jonesii]|uniref:velvet factor n=1 Tax=Fimicolochytrium jonesii TaxID=1396493 RepID=UPI0022FDF958|nr:velvet factor [Fimicolochytrium jonesii]KAI8822467.1 velvet factor [Fimicolochytrium jonesii]
MRQQPETARNQGFSGEKVNYPYVDPCVILQLGILTSSGTVDTSLDTLGDVSSMVVHAHLLSEEGEEDRSTVVVPPIMPPVVYSEQRRVDPPDSRAKSKVPLANNPQPDPGRTQEPRSNLRHAELLLSLSTPDMTTGASSRSSPSSSTSIAPSSDPYYLGQQSAADLLDGDTMEPGPSSLANPAYSSSQPMLDAGVGDGSLLSEGHSRWEQTLFGHLVSSCHFLSDLSGLKGAFFVFPFLAIRVEGNFRLRMVLTNLASLRTTPQRPAETICEIITDPFKSYTGRDYPGAKESSELSIHFADQGVKIPLRRRNQRKRWDSGG